MGEPIDLTLRQLEDVARGLEYLHKSDIIHGDLKGVCLHFDGPLPLKLDD